MFVPGRSTHEAMLKNIYSAINNNKLIGVIFLDIAKAFNCINHDIFDITLANHGSDNRVRRWFSSYSNLFQCVKIRDKNPKRSILHMALPRELSLDQLFLFCILMQYQGKYHGVRYQCLQMIV